MCTIRHFYPRSPCGERLSCAWSASKLGDFYPRSPCGERPPCRAFAVSPSNNFYPRSPCGERQRFHAADISARRISIHALLAESDTWARGSRVTYIISIHALLAESDARFLCWVLSDSNFYPRSPCGERPNDAINGCNPDFISIHALLAESDPINVMSVSAVQISIHALLAESDKPTPLIRSCPGTFLSTLSLRRATFAVGR